MSAPAGHVAVRGEGGNALPDLPAADLTARFVTDPAELGPWAGAWRRLEEVAAEPNPFLAPAFLEPALRHLGARGVGVLLVTARPRQFPDGEEVLAGLLPVELRRGRAAHWMHSYSFLGTPLVRADSVDEVWDRALAWAFREVRVRTLRLPRMAVEGPVFRGMLEACARAGVPSWVQEQHLRAEFTPAADADAYELRAQARKVRRNLRRARKLLEERGPLDARVERLGPEAVDAWTDEFLALEASGWKGDAGTALSSRAATSAWFREAARGLAADGRLVGARLALDGVPVAMGSVLTAPRGGARAGAYFKIAFDEAFAEFSPGALLQRDLLEWLHGPDGLGHVDSCANAGHPMIDRLWDGRRLIQSTWLGAPRRSGELALALLPFARAAKRALRSKS